VKVRAVLERVAVGRLRATSIVKGFADAMMGLLVAMVVGEGGVAVLKFRVLRSTIEIQVA
jgi:hypothetical protein